MNRTHTLTRRLVVQNIATLFSGSALSQALTAIILLLTARQLGPNNYGAFTSSLVLASITALVFNLGLDLWYLQAAGKKPESTSRLFGSILGIKLLFSCVWFTLLIIIHPFLNRATFPTGIYYWTAGVVWLDSLFLTTLTAFKATLQNRYTLILEPTSDLLWLIGTVWLIKLNISEVTPYLQVRFVVLFFSLLLALFFIWRLFRIHFSWSSTKIILREMPPYGISEFLATTTMRMDLLIVALFLGSQAAGLYSPALSVVNALFFIPAAVANVMIPVLSRLTSEYPEQARKTAIRQIGLQAVIGVGMFVVMLIGAPILVKFLGESFAGSLQLLYILSFVLLLKPLTFGAASILVASGNQDRRVIVQFVVAILSILLDLLAVFYFGLTTVAIVYVLVEFSLLTGYTLLAWKYGLKSRQDPGDEPKLTDRIHPASIKVLLANIHSTNNAGDYSLMMESIHQIERNFPADTKITLVMDDPQEISGNYAVVTSIFGWVLRGHPDGKTSLSALRICLLPFNTLLPLLVYRMTGYLPGWLSPASLKPLLNAMTAADIVVSVAGGFLYSSSKGMTLLLKLYSTWLASVADKPVYLFPQSIGPLNKSWEHKAARLVLSQMRLIMVREPISLGLVQSYRIQPSRTKLLPDLGFGFQGASPEEVDNWCENHGIVFPDSAPILGMTVINWEMQYKGFSNQAKYENACIAGASHFISSTGGRVMIFPQVFGPTLSQDDRVISRRIVAGLAAHSERVIFIDTPIPPDILKSLYKKMTIFMGTRMHSNIFALSEGVPVLAIGYLHKTKGIMQMLKLDRWMIDINDIEADQVVQRLDELFLQRQEVAEQIKRVMPEIQRQINSAGELIYTDFNKYKVGPGFRTTHNDS